MNASTFMDKQIMDLSRSKTDLNNTGTGADFIDLMNTPAEDAGNTAGEAAEEAVNKEEIRPSYDFQPIRRHAPLSSFSDAGAVHSSNNIADVAARVWNSSDSGYKASALPVRNYSSLEQLEPEKVAVDKARHVNDSAIVSEIDQTMKRYTDNLLYAIDGLSARISQLENRTRHLENSMDDIKVSIGNNHGVVDGKMRQLENILREVQTGVQKLKDKQEVMEAQTQLTKLHIQTEQAPETQTTMHMDPIQQPASAPPPPPPPSNHQFPVAASQSLPALVPPNAPPPPPPQQNLHPPVQMPAQFPQVPVPPVPQHDAYFPPPGQAQEMPAQHYPTPAPPQPPLPPTPQPQQYPLAPTPPYPQAPQPPPQFQPPLSHHPDETPLAPPQIYPPNRHQPTSGAPPSQPFYSAPSSMYEPPPSRPSAGFSSGYAPIPAATDPCSYGGPPSHYGSSSPMKPQPHSPRGGSSYPQIPTARVLPQAIPTASGISGGGSSSGGGGNRVPIDDVVDKVTNMGFPRDHVRATVRKLTENGQAVDLNVVLDKLMNDGELQPPRGGWFGR